MSSFILLPGLPLVNGSFSPLPVTTVQKEKPLKWSEARRSAIRRDRTCSLCSSTSLLTVHHIWPRGLGGGHELENLVTLCEPCHQHLCKSCTREKSARVPGWAQSEHKERPVIRIEPFIDSPYWQDKEPATPAALRAGAPSSVPALYSHNLTLFWEQEKTDLMSRGNLYPR